MKEVDRRSFLEASSALGAIALAPNLQPTGRGPLPGGPLNVGLVGAGRQGRALLGELQKLEDVNVTAVCDVIASRRRSGLRRAQGAAGFEDHRRLLDEAAVDAVVVATPTHLHRGAVVDALERGKHVYCEAPLASTLEDCRAIVGAGREAQGVLQVGMQARSNPIYALARSFVRSGAVRDLVSFRAQMHEKTSWRFPSANPADEAALNWRLDPALSLGLAGEFGVHQFDVFHWFLNDYPTAVRGAGSLLLHDDGREVPDTVQCELEFPGGRRLLYEASLANSFEGTYELLHGTMGTIKLAGTAGWMFKEADAPTQGWEVYAIRETYHREEGITLIADATKLARQNELEAGVGLPHPPLYYALTDFVESCAGTKPVVCPAGEGLRAALVSIRAAQAVESGERLVIDPAELEER
jgi:predicted dehydrogenase